MQYENRVNEPYEAYDRYDDTFAFLERDARRYPKAFR